MELLPLEQVEVKLTELLALLPDRENHSWQHKVTFNHTEAWNCEIPLVEVDDRYHYKFYERCTLTSDKTTQDIEELLYWVCRGTIFRVACDYELENRMEGQDGRRQIFAKELELFGYLGERYVALHQEHIRNILARAPYRD